MYYSNLSSGNQFLPALTRHPVFVAASGRIYLHKKLLDSVGRYIERERERVRPGQAGQVWGGTRHKISQCFGPSSLNTNSERCIDFSIYSRNENLCFISFSYQRGSFYAARPYMRVVIVRWQVVVLVFPENLPRPGFVLPTPLSHHR